MVARFRKSATRLVRAFAVDRTGISAVEFALIVPIMIPIYFGAVDFSEGFAVKRNVTHVASAIGDLVTQSKELTTAEMDDIFAAAVPIMRPYPASDLKMVLTQVKIDDEGKATVDWSISYGSGATSPAKGSEVTLPAEVKQDGSYVIIAEAQYLFTPITKVVTGDIPFTERFYLRPRLSESVEYPKS